MKKLGVIAGIGPESTIEYYRMIIKIFQDKLSTKDYPEVIFLSINMTEMLKYVFSDNLEGLGLFLKDRIQILEDAGAEFAVLASNTPHLIFDKIRESVGIPMISIVEETCKHISHKEMKRIGLLGTKSTMSKGFYQSIGMKYNLEIVSPNEEIQNYVHQKYMEELVLNQIIPKTKKRFIEIIEKLRVEERIEGLILGGTELPLILKQEDFGKIHIFNTTQIHVNSIVERMLEK